MRRALLALALIAAPSIVVCGSPPPPTAAAAGGKEDFGGDAVVFARDQSLWRTDPKGKGPAAELVALPGPARDVRMIRADPTGRLLLFDLGGVWWWTRLDAAGAASAPVRLPCADAAARLTADARMVVCANDRGKALVTSLVTGKTRTLAVAADGVRIVVGDGRRELIWAGPDGVWTRRFGDPAAAPRQLAPEAPLRGFLAAPDGSRAAAIYPGTVFEKRQKVAAEVLDGFALDGTAARRMLHRDAKVLDWSWDSTWMLVQVGDEACITRSVGGQYKCWKGYTAVSLGPDGRWALLLGPRKGGAAAAEPEPDEADGVGGEGSEEPDEAEAPAPVPGLPAAPFSLYRARLEGAHTEKPSLVETVVDGAALWLPADEPAASGDR